MSIPIQYSPARVVRLLYAIDSYNSYKINRQQPNIGDVGILIDYQTRAGVIEKYVVELVDPKGVTLWLCDFDAEEIEAPEPED